MKFNFKLLVIAMLALVMASITGCSKNKAVNDTIIFTQEGEPASLDPYRDDFAPAIRLYSNIYSRLVDKDENLNIKPSLAESWEYLDDNTLQLKLRKDVKFHNGDPLTAEDVKYSLEKIKKTPLVFYILPAFKEINIIDDYTINLVTKTPFGPLLLCLTHPSMSIVSKKIVEANDNALDRNPIGTGPYKFVSWDTDGIKLERNEHYFGEKAKAKYIISKNVPTSLGRLNSLIEKTSDIAMLLNATELSPAMADPDVQVQTRLSNYYYYIGLNQKFDKFKDIKIRHAISYAINKQAILDEVINGQGQIASSPVPPNVFGFTKKTEAGPYDVEISKSLLAEAGYPNGFKVSLTLLPRDEDLAKKIVSDLEKVGIEVTLNYKPPSEFYSYVESGATEMFIGGAASVISHAHDILENVAFGSYYDNKQLDDLLELASSTINPEEQKIYYEQAQELIVDEAIDVMLFYPNVITAYRKDILGLAVDSLSIHDLTKVYRETK